MRHGLKYTGLQQNTAANTSIGRCRSQEDFGQLEAMGFVWFRNEWVWEKRIVPGLGR